MLFSELSARYARALFEEAKSAGTQDKVFSDLRGLLDVFSKDEQLQEFFTSPLIKADAKEQVLSKALEDKGLEELVKNFALVLAQKDRMGLFPEIVEAYQFSSDEAHGVTRGTVRSASVLLPEQRQQIEDIVAKVTGKQVILTYKEDPQLIGGLIAEVGSYTFDDTLTSHLRRLKEELNRRAH